VTREKRHAARRAARTAVTSRFVVLTGVSGSGKSQAMRALEDLGYFCVDNLPVMLLPTLAELTLRAGSEIARAAVVVDVREGRMLEEFPGIYRKLKGMRGLNPVLIFLDAAEPTLVRRFSETRRPHPYETDDGLAASIRAEREAMADIRAHADLIIDTSEHNVHSLRRYLVERFSPDAEGAEMRVQVLSFGHKYGGPRDVDLLFDVRHLPNPHFEPELRHLSGSDRRIVQYLKSQPETAETLRRFGELLDYLLPLYRREGKSYVTVGVGCTGGRHRSVMMANAIARHLRRQDYEVSVAHRDVRKTRAKRLGK
jgi:UPF0042 nucleotide-binding protein